MTFLLRQLSRTAEGREIVRATKVERDTVMIGRASGSDIVVPDLAVAPQHAMIGRKGARRISVTAETGFKGADAPSPSPASVSVPAISASPDVKIPVPKSP